MIDSRETINSEEKTDDAFIEYFKKQEETLPPDGLTDEQREKMAKDFEKDDIHKIIGNNSDIAKIVEKYKLTPEEARIYRECINWPKAQKRQMREMEAEIQKHRTPVNSEYNKTYLADAIDAELKGEDEDPEPVQIEEFTGIKDTEWIDEWVGDRILKNSGDD